MSASLVGSEMCIRDSHHGRRAAPPPLPGQALHLDGRTAHPPAIEASCHSGPCPMRPSRRHARRGHG
eukprot:12674464-Alexandrium_andersonii.AAC.1